MRINFFIYNNNNYTKSVNNNNANSNKNYIDNDHLIKLIKII